MTDKIDKNHIKLDGSIPYGSPLKKFMYSREALVCAGLIGLSAYLGGLENNPSFTLTYYASLIGGSALGRAGYNWSLKRTLSQYFGSAHDDLYINKKPDANTLPTKPEHIAASRAIRNRKLPALLSGTAGSAAAMSIMILSPSVAETLSQSAAAPSPLTNTSQNPLAMYSMMAAYTVISSSIITAVAKEISATWRFNQVVRGKHVITDEPPKKTKTVPLSEDITRTFGKFLPEPKGKPEMAMLPAPEPDHF